MTIRTFPSQVRGANLVQWGLVANTQSLRSPFDATEQTVENPGARWAGSVSWSNLPYDQGRILTSFLASLGGKAGRFTFTPPNAWRRAVSTISGTVRVNGAGQTGTSLAIDGLPNSVVVFEAGDWISFPNAASRPQLHQIWSQKTSNGSGQATVDIAPPLRGSPADNAEVTWLNPVGVFMLADDSQGAAAYDGSNNRRISLSIDIMEALA